MTTPGLNHDNNSIFTRRRDIVYQFCCTAPSDKPIWRVMGIAFALGCFAHLLIADTWQLSWIVPDIFLLTGAIIVLLRPCALGFILCIPGLLWPLLFLRDQLTQSVLLLLFSTSAATALLLPRFSIKDAIQTWRLILVSTYALATLHKLNTDFLNPSTSCANYGWSEILHTWDIPALTHISSPLFFDALPGIVIATEALLTTLYLLRLRRLAWTLAIAFHLPLTMTMAPAFFFVMMIGHIAWAEEEDLTHIKKLTQSHPKTLAIILCTSLIPGGFSLALTRITPEPSMVVRELMIWALLGLSLSWPITSTWGSFLQRKKSILTRPSPLAMITGGFILLHSVLLPYTGKKMHHAGAMLSNLRTDAGCWNSIVFPESMRLTDDYIRVNSVYFHHPGHDPEYEQLLTQQLWSPPQLRQMQRNWCAPHNRPFFLQGTFKNRTFTIEDLCALQPHELPFKDAGILNLELFPDALRFQKNLQRACPQKCIH